MIPGKFQTFCLGREQQRVPFGQTVLLWRLERRLTQAVLAKKARIPRPNLSGIERGKREVSLGTLRALAEALGLRPGILADGIPPSGILEKESLSRETLERIAKAAAQGRPRGTGEERKWIQALWRIIRSRTEAAKGIHRRNRPITRASDRAWLHLTQHSPALAQSLIERVNDEIQRNS